MRSMPFHARPMSFSASARPSSSKSSAIAIRPLTPAASADPASFRFSTVHSGSFAATVDCRRAVLHCSDDCCRRNYSPMTRRLLQAKLFSFAATKIRIGRGALLRQGQAPLRRLLLRIMPSPWRPVPACVRNDIPQAGHSPLRQRRMESDADLVAATTVADGPIFVAATKIRIGRGESMLRRELVPPGRLFTFVGLCNPYPEVLEL